MVNVHTFPKRRPQVEFLTGDALRMCLTSVYTPKGPVTSIGFGADTFFSLWVGHADSGRHSGFTQALEAQGPRHLDTEELFASI